MVLVAKVVLYGQRPKPQITASVVLLVAGCLVAGLGDLGFDAWGYTAGLASCACQALYLLLVEVQVRSGARASRTVVLHCLPPADPDSPLPAPGTGCRRHLHL